MPVAAGDVRFRYGVKQHFAGTAGVKEGELFELALAAVGDTLTVFANGKQVGQIRDTDITRPGEGQGRVQGFGGDGPGQAG